MARGYTVYIRSHDGKLKCSTQESHMKKVTVSFKLVEGSRNDDGTFVQHGPSLKEVKRTFLKRSDLVAWLSESQEMVFKYIEVGLVFFSRTHCADGRAFDELTVLSRQLP